MNRARTLFTLIASSLLLGCASLTTPSVQPQKAPQVAPLVVANCPALSPLLDSTMGGLADKLIEVAGVYYVCARSAGVEFAPAVR